MPTPFTHFAVGASFALPLRKPRSKSKQPRLRTAGVALFAGVFAVIADLDTIFFGLIPYEHFWGHRGFVHSPAFAAALALVISSSFWLLHRGFNWKDWIRLALVLVLGGVSHSVLDALTDGGLGVMLLYPLSEERIFAPWRPIPVSPIGIDGISGPRLLTILRAELPFATAFLGAGWILGWVKQRLFKLQGESG